VSAAGPFGTEREARDYAATAAGARGARERNHRMLDEACAAAGVELGAFDHRVIQWLSQWEPGTCAVVAGLITRAARRGGETP
jgi:hypothetical protein